MKIKSCFIIAFLFIIVIANISLFAQIENCKSECKSDVWIPNVYQAPKEVEIELEKNEYFTVSYRTRISCNKKYDYYIESITPQKKGMLLKSIKSLGGFAEFMKQINFNLLVLNPAKFPPLKNGECEDFIRIFKSPCWRIDKSKTKEIALPCPAGECLEEVAQVCYNNDNMSIFFRRIPSQENFKPCTNSSIRENIFECTFILSPVK